MSELNELLLTTPDLRDERITELKRLFPDLVTAEGRLIPDALRQLLDGDAGPTRERYEFNWSGKARAKRHAFTPSRAALTYDLERSVNPEKADGNLIIEGENLEVLKLLTAAYREQVKCIYIDPPYNIGGDYIYSDDYTQDKKSYWELNGAYEQGVKMDTNPDTSGRYHSDWLSMMYSRLLNARPLLKEDGVIFISIDDTELHNLRKLLDEVFGEENFLATLPRRVKTGGGSAAHHFAIEHDYVVVYAKNKAKLPPLFIPHDEEYLKRYSEEDEEGRYYWDTMERSYTQTKPYKITAPDGQVLEGNWFRSEARFYEDLENGEVRFLKKDDGSWSVQFKQRMGPGRKLRSLLHQNTFKSTHDEITELGLEGAFSFPKPTSLIKLLVHAACPPDSQSIVLDFFAGSGTTGQAVMELNQEDYNGSLQFILVQLPEAIDEEHEAFKSGFRTISEIAIERNKRVVNGYGKVRKPLPTGFKVYQLTKSHFPRVEFQPDPDKTPEENVELLKQYIAEKESGFQITFDQDKVFDEVLLKHGFMLDYSLTEVEEIAENKVYIADDGTRQAFICLDIAISDATVDYFKEHTEEPFICLERALDTTKKWNLKHALGERLKSI